MRVLLLEFLVHFDRRILAEQQLGRGVVLEHLVIVAGMFEATTGAARALQELVGTIVVQPHDCVIWQERKLLAVRVVPHVATILEVILEIR